MLKTARNYKLFKVDFTFNNIAVLVNISGKKNFNGRKCLF